MLRLVLTAAFLLLTVGQGGAETRKALVIGNEAYAGAPLQNPLNDARSLAGALLELDFEVVLAEDLDHSSMTVLAETVAREFAGVDLALFYFAGHAVQLEGTNYLLPVDFDMQAADVKQASLSLNTMLAAMEAADVGVSLIVLDACRNPPFADASAFGRGLADVTARGETLVAFATAAGETAVDGQGINSPYTAALVSALELEGQELHSVFRNVRARVREATDGRQLPWVSSSIEREVILRAPGRAASEAAPGSATELHWLSIADSRDPGDFEYFLATQPRSEYADEARVRQAETVAAGIAPVPALETTDEALPLPDGGSVAITDCDLAASDPLDPRRIAPGIAGGLVNTRFATRVCAAAISEDPGNPRLNFLLGRTLEIAQRFELAHDFHGLAVEGGYGAAMRNLGFLTRTGRGVDPDPERAARLYFQAAMLGIPDARKALAKMYEEGWGVPRSTTEMLRWLHLSAEDNYPPALDHLGNLYRAGEVVPQDLEKAEAYYRRAAALGNSNAMANLGRLYRDGIGVAADAAEAMRWYALATENGNGFAPYHLSEFYRQGLGPATKDLARAEELLRLSADRGYEWALWRLARYAEEGALGSPDLSEAAFYYTLAELTGTAIRHKSGDELAADAGAELAELRSELSEAEFAAARTRAESWFAGNSIYDFGLLYQY